MTDPVDRAPDSELDDQALEALAEACATGPPPGLRARVLEAVADARERSALRSRLYRWRQLGIAACAAAATLAIYVLSQPGTAPSASVAALEQERALLRVRIETQERDLRLLEEALNVHGEVARILTARAFRSAPLVSTTGGDGYARVLLDPDSGAVAILGRGLPPPQSGRVYELWAIKADGTPEPAGTLEPSGRSFAVRMKQVSEPDRVQRFALSVEPGPGARQPSGPYVLAGSVQRPQP